MAAGGGRYGATGHPNTALIWATRTLPGCCYRRSTSGDAALSNSNQQLIKEPK